MIIIRSRESITARVNYTGTAIDEAGHVSAMTATCQKIVPNATHIISSWGIYAIKNNFVPMIVPMPDHAIISLVGVPV